MRILQIVTDTNVGGAGKLLLNILNHMDYSRFEIFVAVPENSALIPMIEKTRASVIPTNYGKDRSFEVPAVKELIKIIGEVHPDVVHTNASLSGRIAARKAKVKMSVMTRHCAFPPKKYETRFPVKQMYGFCNNRLSDVYIATAENVKKQLVETGCSEKKIVVIPNGTEAMKMRPDRRNAVRSQYGIPKNAFVVGMAARLESYKGQEVLLRAAKRLKEYNIYYVLAGTGSQNAELKYLVKEYGLKGKVIFAGYCPEMEEIYSACDLHVNCSVLSESTSLAILETMSMGIPNIVTNIGGNAEVVDDGINGYVIPAEDEAALVQSVLKLYYDEDTRKEFAEKAKEKFLQKFTVEQCVKKLEKVYLGGIHESTDQKAE